MIDLNLSEPPAPETAADKRAREAYEGWAALQQKRLDLSEAMGILKRFILVRV